MSRILRLDSEGNDITPMCEIADGIVSDAGCGKCVLKDDCPSYYDGCFEVVNGSNCMMEWISVKDNLPGTTKEGYVQNCVVLIKSYNSRYPRHALGFYTEDVGWCVPNALLAEDEKVIAWFPLNLPAPSDKIHKEMREYTWDGLK